MGNMRTKIVSTLIFISLLSGCADFKEEKIYYRKYTTGWSMKVTKIINRHSEPWSFGYNQKSTYQYSLTLSPNDIQWTGNIDVVPKNILICKNEKYLRYVQYRTDAYAKHVDRRYFFNYFGNQWWRIVPESEYTKAEEKCVNLLVPGDEWEDI
jgi:hypothetical protein